MSNHAAPVVAWERLELQGFGRHRQLTIAFPEGVAVWIAPNEAGKSTAVLGLIATIWGIPHVQETQGFTWGRFRNIDGGPYRGAVTFTRDGARFTVHRRFDDHHVRVVEHQSQGDREVFRGEHNPNARRDAGVYAAWLRDTFGIDDAALLLSTFVVAQGDLGGPPHQLSERVQALLTGSGGGTAAAAIERLEVDLRATTRNLKGLTPNLTRDGRSDGALETAQTRVQEIQATLQRGREKVDALVPRQREAEAAAIDVRTQAEAARSKRALANARKRWLELREQAHAAVRRAAEVQSAVTEAERLAREHAQVQATATNTHPELASLPSGSEATFTAFDRAAVRQLEAQTRVEEARAATRESEEALEDASKAAAQAAAASAAAPSGTRELLDGVIAAAPRWRAAYGAIARERQRIDEARTRLASLAPLADLDERQVEALQHIPRLAAERQLEVRELEGVWRVRSEQLNAVEARYRKAASLTAEQAAALERFAQAHEEPPSVLPWRWVGALIVGLVGAVVAFSGLPWFEGDSTRALALAAGLALVWVLAFPRRFGLKQARARLDAFTADGAPALAGDDQARLQLARERLAFEASGVDIDRLRQDERAAHAPLLAAKAALEDMEKPWVALREALLRSGWDGAAAEPLQRALETYQRVARELADAGERATATAWSVGASGIAAFEPNAKAASSGRDGDTLMAWLANRAVLPHDASVAALDDWLRHVDDARWQRYRSEVAHEEATHQTLLQASLAAQARVAALQAEVDERARRVAAEEAQLRSATDALHAATPAAWPDGYSHAEELMNAWRTRQQTIESATLAGERLQTHLRARGVEDLSSAQLLLQAANLDAQAALDAWRALVSEHPTLPPADLGGARNATDPSAFFASAEADAALAEAASERARERLLEAQKAIAVAQGVDAVDVAALEIDLQEARDAVARWQVERDALALAAQTLHAAAEAFRSDHAATLADAATRRWQLMGAPMGRRVTLDERMRAGVVELDGQALAVDQLSQGARDQLALALRLAIADLVADATRLPLILDDPFLNWDQARATAAKQTLRVAASEGHAVWLLSHREAFSEWGSAVTVVNSA